MKNVGKLIFSIILTDYHVRGSNERQFQSIITSDDPLKVHMSIYAKNERCKRQYGGGPTE